VAAVAKRSLLRIVVADDERDAVIALQLLLCAEGHQVRGVHCGSEVLAVVRDFNPHAVLVDIAMPDMSGYNVAREIRASHPGNCPLLIGISGRYQQKVDRTVAALSGFNHYLLKPYDFRALLALLV
jgi:DNA-binding response OmpR family regulator